MRHLNMLKDNLALTAAIAIIDSEAKRRGHCVLIQELDKSRAGWRVSLWAKGDEKYDSFYERIFSHELRVDQ